MDWIQISFILTPIFLATHFIYIGMNPRYLDWDDTDLMKFLGMPFIITVFTFSLPILTVAAIVLGLIGVLVWGLIKLGEKLREFIDRHNRQINGESDSD